MQLVADEDVPDRLRVNEFLTGGRPHGRNVSLFYMLLGVFLKYVFTVCQYLEEAEIVHGHFTT